MSGGIIEGIKKCYTGNNVATKHIFLLIIAVLVSIPSVITSLNTNGEDAEVYKYMYFQYPLLGIISLLGSFLLAIYMVQFLRNTLKFCYWKEKQTDEAKINALQIMPEINSNLFNNIGELILFWIIWTVMLLLITVIFALFCLIPPAIIFAILAIVVIWVAFCFSMPYILCGFVKDFNLGKNLNPLLMFTYLPKIFAPAVILDLKLIGLVILLGIAGITLILISSIIYGIIAGIAGMSFQNLEQHSIFLTLVCSVYIYVSAILSLGFYYAVAHVFYENVEKAEKQDPLPDNDKTL